MASDFGPERFGFNLVVVRYFLVKGKQMKALEIMKRFFKDERGLETVEYAVMTALIVAVIITAITALATAIGARFDDVTTVINTIP
jgi:Flp pilus assembly pilin Flp